MFETCLMMGEVINYTQGESSKEQYGSSGFNVKPAQRQPRHANENAESYGSQTHAD